MNKQLLPYDEGMKIYKEVAAVLVRPCQKIAVAGSLRRGKTTVKDVEVVCVPEPDEDLLGHTYYTSDAIRTALDRLRHNGINIRGGDKYLRVFLEDINAQIDIFITTPNQWGLIYAIRTGSADFSKWLVTGRRHGGALPSYFKVKDGWLLKKNERKTVVTEEHFFETIGIKYIIPEKREIAPWGKTEFYI